MNKDQLMEYLSTAIDQGAKIEVTFHSHGVTDKPQAEEMAKQFSEIVGVDIIEKGTEYATWYQVGRVSSQIQGMFFYDDYMVDDIFGEGDESA